MIIILISFQNLSLGVSLTQNSFSHAEARREEEHAERKAHTEERRERRGRPLAASEGKNRLAER